jgi:hypothetical protein
MKKLITILIIALRIYAYMQNCFAQNAIIWKNHFGGYSDSYYSVTAVSDGIIAVGYAERWSFGNGDWTGVEGKGDQDAIIVKYDNNGNVVWRKNFGGRHSDYYHSVTTVSDGVVAVGWADIFYTSDGDWTGMEGYGDGEAIIVKYDNDGNVVWKKFFGGSDWDQFNSVTTVSDGIIAVGYALSFDGDLDYLEVEGYPAIIVKYDNNGNVIWKKKSESNYSDYQSVIAVSNGIIAVGNSVIIKYDNNGNVIWEKNFAANYCSVTVVSDGVIAAGKIGELSFGHGDWEGINGKGEEDAIIVKYDNNGNEIWKKNFGGSKTDLYNSVVAITDGVIAVELSQCNSDYEFGNGDWTGYIGKGGADAIIIKYDNNGNVV